MVVEEFELFVDGSVPVAIAIDRMAEDRDTALVIDHRGDADMNHAAIAEIALGDVSGRQETIAGHRKLVRLQEVILKGPRKGILVDATEEKIRGVEVKAIQREVGELQGAKSGVSDDGMAFGEEGVQGASQAI